jgi:hypothetical protein
MILSSGGWMRVLLRVSVYWGDDDMGVFCALSC